MFSVGVGSISRIPLRKESIVKPDSRRIADLLHEAAEAHHIVYRITDGEDDDWASWYADWLVHLSELPELLERRPVCSHLVHELVECELAFAREEPEARWEDYYGNRIEERFA